MSVDFFYSNDYGNFPSVWAPGPTPSTGFFFLDTYTGAASASVFDTLTATLEYPGSGQSYVSRISLAGETV